MASLADVVKVAQGVESFKAGDAVWVEDEEQAWAPAVVSYVNRGSIEVIHSKESETPGERVTCDVSGDTTSKIISKKQNMRLLARSKATRLPKRSGAMGRAGTKDKEEEGYENMDDMTHLHEASILNNLELRYWQNSIYTATGPILIAINPYQRLPIYGKDMMKKYVGATAGSIVSPHCYGIAQEAYADMKLTGKNQCLVICGESGAGKTETTKLMLRYISNAAAKGGEGRIENLIMQSNPIMEAFGNAKTLRNDNSSRFGKFIKVQFNAQGYITGAVISNYLLEKSRIVKQPFDERNYHIFYQFCAGADAEMRDLCSMPHTKNECCDAFHYLAESGCTSVHNIDDKEEWKLLQEAMKVCEFSEGEQKSIFCVLAGILHLGNLTFRAGKDELAEIIASGEGAGLEIMSNLFGCPPEILGDAIVTKSISVGGKTIKSRVNCAEAEFARDALAKGIYGRLFDWLVRKLNKSTIQVDRPKTFLGILDIYGFENLEPNGFEQLFINYANEKLQDLFNTHIFHLEEAEYRKEKIEFSSKDFPSNKACLALIEKPPMGIMSLMDEECLMGKGSDASLARKIHKRYGKAGSGGRVRAAVRKRSQPKIPVGAEDKQGNGTAAITGSKEKKQPVPSDYFEACGPSTKWRGRDQDFVIKHYAGNIMYTCDGFVEKNKDTLRETVIDIMKNSDIKLVGQLFVGSGASAAPAASAGSSSRRGAGRSLKQARPKAMRRGTRSGTSLQITVSKRFRDQLGRLMSTMSATSPRFVRCIKSNEEKKANSFDRNSVLRQLKYAGVLEALRIRRAGYPNRLLYRDFLLRYLPMISKEHIDAIRESSLSESEWKGEVAALIKKNKLVAAILREGQYQLGVTKIFLRTEVLATLDKVKNRFIEASVIKIQRIVRAFVEAKRYARLKMAALNLQSHMRGLIARKQHAKMVKELNEHIAAMKKAAAEREARERKEREERERREREERQRDEAMSLLDAAENELRGFRKLEDDDGVVLQDKDPVVIKAISAACQAIEKAAESYQKSSEVFLAAAKSAAQIVHKASVSTNQQLKHRNEARRIRIRKAEEERKRLAQLEAERKRKELAREAAALMAMRKEEERQRKVETAIIQLRLQNEQRELATMRAEEANQRAVAAELERRRKMEEARRIREEQLRVKRELELMRKEEKRTRWLVAEQKRFEQLRLQEEKKRDMANQARELLQMRREELAQRKREGDLLRRWREARAKWIEFELAREAEERALMHRSEEEQDALRRAEEQAERDKIAAWRERVLMQNEDGASRTMNLSYTMKARMEHIAALEAETERQQEEERESALDAIRRIGNSLEKQSIQFYEEHARSSNFGGQRESKVPEYREITGGRSRTYIEQATMLAGQREEMQATNTFWDDLDDGNGVSFTERIPEQGQAGSFGGLVEAEVESHIVVGSAGGGGAGGGYGGGEGARGGEREGGVMAASSVTASTAAATGTGNAPTTPIPGTGSETRPGSATVPTTRRFSLVEDVYDHTLDALRQKRQDRAVMLVLGMREAAAAAAEEEGREDFVDGEVPAAALREMMLRDNLTTPEELAALSRARLSLNSARDATTINAMATVSSRAALEHGGDGDGDEFDRAAAMASARARAYERAARDMHHRHRGMSTLGPTYAYTGGLHGELDAEPSFLPSPRPLRGSTPTQRKREKAAALHRLQDPPPGIRSAREDHFDYDYDEEFAFAPADSPLRRTVNMRMTETSSPKTMQPLASPYQKRESSSRLPPSLLDTKAASHPSLPLPPPGIRSVEKLMRQRRQEGRTGAGGAGRAAFRDAVNSASDLGLALNLDLNTIQNLHEAASKSTEKTKDFLSRFGVDRASQGTEGLFSPIATRQQQRGHFGEDERQHSSAPTAALSPAAASSPREDLGRKRLHDLISAGAAILGPETPTVLKRRLAENVFGSDEIYAHLVPPQVERHRSNVLAGHYSIPTAADGWMPRSAGVGSGSPHGGVGLSSGSVSDDESEVDRIHRKIQAMAARGRNGGLARYDE